MLYNVAFGAMWYCNNALRYFWPNLLNKKPLILGPSFLNASFVGAKSVRPTDELLFSASMSSAFTKPSSRVLKVVGRWEMIAKAGGGGNKMLDRPWMRPFEAPYSLLV